MASVSLTLCPVLVPSMWIFLWAGREGKGEALLNDGMGSPKRGRGAGAGSDRRDVMRWESGREEWMGGV